MNFPAAKCVIIKNARAGRKKGLRTAPAAFHDQCVFVQWGDWMKPNKFLVYAVKVDIFSGGGKKMKYISYESFLACALFACQNQQSLSKGTV